MVKIESTDELDNERWNEIHSLKTNIYKDTKIEKSIMTKVKDAFDKGDLDKASKLIITLEKDMESLKEKYKEYERNILD